MTQGRVKKVFPGGNTAYGFYSFYDYIIEPDATRILVIKGGPGVGKSTFMRYIGEAMLNRGFDVEYHCCSSDNGSLDGVVIPAIKVALIDGTAPHIVDPKNPGAVDEIIHLGDYWDEDGMRANKDPIIRLNQEVGRLFRKAYGYLKAAKVFLDQVESYYVESGAIDFAGLNRLALQLIDEIFDGKTYNNGVARERHLFATAITPDGPVNHLETIVGHLQKRYVVNGDDGTGKNQLISRIKDAAVMRGYFVEVYHCALDPTKIDHLVIPDLDVAVINQVEPHFYQAKKGDSVADTLKYVDAKLITDLLGERQFARDMYHKAFDQAVSFIARAKQVHDEMEQYYIPNMKFAQINELREETLKRILAWAAESPAPVSKAQ